LSTPAEAPASPVARAALPVDKPAVSQPNGTGSTGDDPEKAAREFIEKNQKIAEAELNTLRKEADALRARLQKVESAIRRWDAVSQALKQTEGNAAMAEGKWKSEVLSGGEPLPAIDTPVSLEPIDSKKFQPKSAVESHTIKATSPSAN
jgi:hypothetical protein